MVILLRTSEGTFITRPIRLSVPRLSDSPPPNFWPIEHFPGRNLIEHNLFKSCMEQVRITIDIDKSQVSPLWICIYANGKVYYSPRSSFIVGVIIRTLVDEYFSLRYFEKRGNFTIAATPSCTAAPLEMLFVISFSITRSLLHLFYNVKTIKKIIIFSRILLCTLSFCISAG